MTTWSVKTLHEYEDFYKTRISHVRQDRAAGWGQTHTQVPVYNPTAQVDHMALKNSTRLSGEGVLSR